jgi:hypothetical protein
LVHSGAHTHEVDLNRTERLCCCRSRGTGKRGAAGGDAIAGYRGRRYGAPSARSIQPWDHHGAALRQSATAEPSMAHIGQK